MKNASKQKLRLISSSKGQEGIISYLLKVMLTPLSKCFSHLVPQTPKPWIRILVYHSIEPYEVSLLLAQLQHILRHYQIIPLHKAIELWKKDHHLTDEGQYVSITFDDGFTNLVHHVAPIFERLKLPATVFLTTGFIEAGIKGDTRPLEIFKHRLACHAKPLTWQEVRNLVEMGFEIGAHTISHRNLTKLPSHTLEKEVVSCKEEIEYHVASQVRYFAYPFGHLLSFNEQVKRVVADARYEAGFTAVRGNILDFEDPLELPRNDMKVAWPSDLIDMYLKGRLEKFLYKLYLWRLRFNLIKYPNE